jgi:hypothetical protein
MLRVQHEDSKLMVYFLYDDEDQSVRVEEVEELSFFRIDRHLHNAQKKTSIQHQLKR